MGLTIGTSSGNVVVSDVISVGGSNQHAYVMKLVYGAAGDLSFVTSKSPLPVCDGAQVKLLKNIDAGITRLVNAPKPKRNGGPTLMHRSI